MKETIQKRLSDLRRHAYRFVDRFVYHDVWLFSDGCDVSVGKLVDNKGSGWYILQMIPLCRQTVWWPK